MSDHAQCQISIEVKAKLEAALKDMERRNAETLMLWQTCDQLGRDMVEVKTTLKMLVEMQSKTACAMEKHMDDSVQRIKKIEELDQFKKGATFGLGVLFTALIGFVVERFTKG